MARNRVIYQSEALFVSPNATGAHFTCTALTTGLGPTGHLGAATTFPKGVGAYANKSGNYAGVVALVDPVGLNQDPAITRTIESNYPVAGDIIGDIADVGEDGAAAGHLELADLYNLSGAGVEAMLQAVTGGEVYPHGLPGGLTPKSGQTTRFGLANTSGTLHIYGDTKSWEAAQAVYHKEDGAPGQLFANKDIVGPGLFLQPFSGTYENLVQQIHRVQSANYSFTINRTDVNTFGQLARIDAIALEPPTVNLDFTYFPTDGFNERNLGFYLKGDGSGVGMGTATLNAATNHLQSDNAGKNFFIVTTPESTDAFNSNDPVSDRSVIGLGNGFLSDYTLEASVGSIPTVSATIELYNAKSDIGTTGVTIPGVDLANGSPASGINYSLAHPSGLRGDEGGAAPNTGEFGYAALSALKPGDIALELPQELSMFSKISGDGSVHIQNFSLSLPLSRSPIDRIGTRFAFSRVVDLPVVASLSVSALVSEVGTGNLALLLDDCKEHDVRIKLAGSKSCQVGERFDAMIIDFKGARIDSESISSDIGSNKSVDLTFTTQIGGPEDLIHGVFISGANPNVIPGHSPIPGR